MNFHPTDQTAKAMSTQEKQISSVSTQSYRIRRIGARPLSFSGSELAMAMSFTPDLPYWYEINIYRTDNQKFVLAIKKFFQDASASDHCNCWEFDTLEQVFDALEAYDASNDIIFSTDALQNASAPELAANAMHLKAEVKSARAHFATLVGEIFADIEEAVRLSN